jgi:hypothetical protein
MSRLVLAYARRHHVGLLALFVALGGTSYAATRLNGADLKNRSVSGHKLKRGTVTRKELSLKKLGKLPSAERADRASRASRADRAGVAERASRATRSTSATFAAGAGNSNRLQGLAPSAFLPASRVRTTRLFYANNGQSRTVFSAPPFTVSVSCTNVDPNDIARWRVSSREPHMSFYADQTQFFDVAANGLAEAVAVSRPHGDQGQLTTFRDGVFVTPSGAALTLHAYAGVNLPGHAGQCAFAGYAIVS